MNKQLNYIIIATGLHMQAKQKLYKDGGNKICQLGDLATPTIQINQ